MIKKKEILNFCLKNIFPLNSICIYTHSLRGIVDHWTTRCRLRSLSLEANRISKESSDRPLLSDGPTPMGCPTGGMSAAAWPSLAGKDANRRKKPPAASRQSPSCRRPFRTAATTPARATKRTTNSPTNQPTQSGTETEVSAEPAGSFRLALPIS